MFLGKLLKVIFREISYRTRKSFNPAGNDLNSCVEESQSPSIFLGIVDGSEFNSISIGIINAHKHTVSYKSFSLIETSLLETRALLNEDKSISELEAIADFLRDQVLEPENAQVLMEIPSAILDVNSLYLKILLLLSRKGYCGFEIKFIEKNKHVQLGFQYFISYDQGEIPVTYLVSEKVRLTARIDHGVIYLQKNMSKAYAQLLLGASPSSECVAVFAALIAKNKNLYYFLNSEGQVQSSKDLLEFMRNHEEGYPTAVIAGSEVFVTLKLPITEQGKIEKIPLKYAVAKKQYNFLGEDNALKFALLNVCKLWKIRLYCLSFHEKNGARLLNSDTNFLNPDTDDFFPLPKRYVIYEPSKELGLVESNALLVSINKIQRKHSGLD
ncbi:MULTISPECIES: hypothetical protein [unclassified Moorena]|uniref:hypothetical protein n=1 Tax=unclassified Moorena TaxID=2683338 RepID=UPI0014011F86|nr:MULTISPECIES: hypothetical protein [unclassified Moorena]NEO13952.1 hypothetical protein [Moorena sp. SIO3E8]NEQ00014.1 hypothetical protein [Moorena sp. SIO3F7]